MFIDDCDDIKRAQKHFTWKDYIHFLKNSFPEWLVTIVIGGIEIAIIAGVITTVSKCMADIRQNNVYLVTSENCVACNTFESDNPFTKLNAFGQDFHILKIQTDPIFVNDIQRQYGKPIESIPFIAYKDKNETWHIYYVVKDGIIDSDAAKQFIDDYNHDFNTSYVYNDKTNIITKGQA